MHFQAYAASIEIIENRKFDGALIAVGDNQFGSSYKALSNCGNQAKIRGLCDGRLIATEPKLLVIFTFTCLGQAIIFLRLHQTAASMHAG